MQGSLQGGNQETLLNFDLHMNTLILPFFFSSYKFGQPYPLKSCWQQNYFLINLHVKYLVNTYYTHCMFV